MYRIGEFSKMGKTTVKTLRHYDAVGLLKPEQVDAYTGYRLYTTRQLVELHRIQSLRQAGLAVSEIKEISEGGDAREILRRRKRELEAQIALEQEQLSRIEFILSGKEEERLMEYQASVKELPECIVYCKRMTVPNYDAYFSLIPAIGEKVAAANPGLKCAVPEYSFIKYLDGEYRDRDINVEYNEAVERMGNDVDDIRFKKIEAVTAVSVMHKGDYGELSNAYAFAFKWIEENGYAVTDSPRESYIDGVWNDTPKESWLTELQVPVRRK